MFIHNKKIQIIFIILIVIITQVLYSQPAINSLKVSEMKFNELNQVYKDYWDSRPDSLRKGWKQFKRWEYFWQNRLMPDGSFPNAVATIRELQNFEGKSNVDSPLSDNSWLPIGPYNNAGTGHGSKYSGIGRINVVRFKPGKPNEIWAGAAAGGVWRSTDKGKTWQVFPYTQFLSLGVSDIAISPSNTNIAYIATGDADGVGSSFNTYSVGIIKTTDNGASWNVTGISSDISQGKMVSKIIIHPSNPDIVIAGTMDGIIKSTDGGVTWKNKKSGYFRDLKFNPDNPDVIIGVTYGNNAAIYKSTDNGETWNQVYSLNGIRGVISYSPGNSNLIYCLITSYQAFQAVVMSIDGGSTWTIQSSLSNSPNILGQSDGTGSDKNYGQGWYDLALAVSPVDYNTLFIGGINIWKSTDAGQSWTMLTHWYGGFGKPYVHADIHDIFISEDSGEILCGSDGGIDLSTQGGDSWTSLNNNINITQFYKVATAQTNVNVMYGGAQDNGSFQLVDGSWSIVNGGDGMDCLVDYKDENIAVVSIYYGDFVKTTDGTNFQSMLKGSTIGEQGGWVTPLTINPINHNSYYAGYTNVWKSVDAGTSWKKISNFPNGTLRCLAVANSDTNTIYAATGSTLSVTHNNGATWSTISGNSTPISNIEIDPANPNKIWLAIGGFQNNIKVMQYDGQSWTNISGNLPNVPVDCIVYQKNSPDRLYIGTDIGVFYSDYSSNHWEFYGKGLPNVIVSDIHINYNAKKLIAGTYGRGVWQTDLMDCNLPAPEIKPLGSTKLCTGDTVVLSVSSEYSNIQWSTGETTNKITVRNAGSYSVSVPGAGGCIARSKAIVVEEYTTPNLVITPGNGYPVCEGDSVNVDMSASIGFSKYIWSTGDTTRKIKIKQPGIYRLTGITVNNCSADASFEIKINPLPLKPVIYHDIGTQLYIISDAKSFQWYRNDTLIPGATSKILIIKDLATYRVVITDNNKCSNTSDNFEVTTGVDYGVVSDNNIDIVPNPTDGKINLFFNNLSGNAVVRITDVMGSVVLTGSYNSEEKNIIIDLTDKANGIYFISITVNNKVFISKVIKN